MGGRKGREGREGREERGEMERDKAKRNTYVVWKGIGQARLGGEGMDYKDAKGLCYVVRLVSSDSAIYHYNLVEAHCYGIRKGSGHLLSNHVAV